MLTEESEPIASVGCRTRTVTHANEWDVKTKISAMHTCGYHVFGVDEASRPKVKSFFFVHFQMNTSTKRCEARAAPK